MTISKQANDSYVDCGVCNGDFPAAYKWLQGTQEATNTVDGEFEWQQFDPKK